MPPTIAEGERLIKVTESSELALECSAKGIPPPKITWQKNGRPLQNDENRLSITNTTTKDSGRYTCEAKNEAGSAFADFVVDVLVKPRVKVYAKDVKVKEGENAKLVCNAEGNPLPTIQ